MVGTVLAPAISPQPLTVAEGRFNLFTVDANNVDTHNMRYRMKMVSEDGRTYYFEGFKVTHPDSVFQVWPATSTLYITIYDGESAASPILGKGILHIAPEDFARQLTTMKVINAGSLAERVAAGSALCAVLSRSVVRHLCRCVCPAQRVQCGCAAPPKASVASGRAASRVL